MCLSIIQVIFKSKYSLQLIVIKITVMLMEKYSHIYTMELTSMYIYHVSTGNIQIYTLFFYKNMNIWISNSDLISFFFFF